MTTGGWIDAPERVSIGFWGRVSSSSPPPSPPGFPPVTPLFGPGSPAAPAEPALNGEIPAFLDLGGCPLYSVYHPARPVPAAGIAALIVPGLGVEQLTGYRSEVELARALARHGIATIRFHPRGQGDSGGDSADLTLGSFADDIRGVLAELRRKSGAPEVVAVGIRLGALALARVVAEGERFKALALWEPVEAPSDYFRSLLRGVLFSQVAQGERARLTVDEMLSTLEREGRVDVLGYYLHRALVASADRPLADRLAGFRGPALIVQIDPRRTLARSHQELAETLRARGCEVEVREVRADVGWPFLQNPAWESPELVNFTTEWIRALG